jgi:protein-tyrosine-phosphatase
MAESVARALGGRAVRASSAGLTPRRRVDPMALHVLRKAGYPTQGLESQGVSATVASRADLVVLLEAESEVLGPLPPTPALERWTVEDPLGWPVDVYEDVLSDVEARVTDLLLRREIPLMDPWAQARTVRAEAVTLDGLPGLVVPQPTA